MSRRLAGDGAGRRALTASKPTCGRRPFWRRIGLPKQLEPRGVARDGGDGPFQKHRRVSAIAARLVRVADLLGAGAARSPDIAVDYDFRAGESLRMVQERAHRYCRLSQATDRWRCGGHGRGSRSRRRVCLRRRGGCRQQPGCLTPRELCGPRRRGPGAVAVAVNSASSGARDHAQRRAEQAHEGRHAARKRCYPPSSARASASASAWAES